MISNKYIVKIKDINTFIDDEVIIQEDVKILMNTIILGKSVIKKGSIIGPNSVIIDSTIGEDSVVVSSFIFDSEIGNKTSIGPFSTIKKNSYIGNECRVGNFVEIKNSKISNNTKAAHLAYIGDAEVGERCNFGCGSITVNYDGKNKYKTIILDDVFIGSNSNLVAPIIIENNSFIACGSTITKDVKTNSLAIARSRQINKVDYFKK